MVAGSIRAPDDASALQVKLSIWDSAITMRADGAELGHWPLNAVVIRPIDSMTFEFVAEGDRLVFYPDNPDEFAALPVVAGANGQKRRKRAKKSKTAKESAGQPAVQQLRWDESTEAEAQLRERQLRAAQRTRKQAAAEQSRRERKAARSRMAPETETASSSPVSRDRVATAAASPPPSKATEKSAKKPRKTRRPVSPPPSAAKPAAAAAPDPAPASPPPTQRSRPPKVKRPSKRRAPRQAWSAARLQPAKEKLEEARHRTWIGLIDLARRYDVFGFDRVPVSAELRREPEHSHTWNHRVAPTSGPGKYICTICGAFRRSGG